MNRRVFDWLARFLIRQLIPCSILPKGEGGMVHNHCPQCGAGFTPQVHYRGDFTECPIFVTNGRLEYE